MFITYMDSYSAGPPHCCSQQYLVFTMVEKIFTTSNLLLHICDFSVLSRPHWYIPKGSLSRQESRHISGNKPTGFQPREQWLTWVPGELWSCSLVEGQPKRWGKRLPVPVGYGLTYNVDEHLTNTHDKGAVTFPVRNPSFWSCPRVKAGRLHTVFQRVVSVLRPMQRHVFS